MPLTPNEQAAQSAAAEIIPENTFPGSENLARKQAAAIILREIEKAAKGRETIEAILDSMYSQVEAMFPEVSRLLAEPVEFQFARAVVQFRSRLAILEAEQAIKTPLKAGNNLNEAAAVAVLNKKTPSLNEIFEWADVHLSAAEKGRAEGIAELCKTDAIKNQGWARIILFAKDISDRTAAGGTNDKELVNLRELLKQAQEALYPLMLMQAENCDGSIGWRSNPEAIAGEVRVKHILAAEAVLAGTDLPERAHAEITQKYEQMRAGGDQAKA